jgi:phage host-nuclease inhibitor protein Gam
LSELHELLKEGLSAGQVLSSIYDIENVLLLVSELDRKIAYYRDLKKRRVDAIDTEIRKLTSKEEMLRSIILNTMRAVAPREKTLNFPDIGKISRRKASDAIVIEDKDSVISYLAKAGVKAELVRISEDIDKRKFNTWYADHSKSGANVPGVNIVPGDESLSVSFEEEEESVQVRQQTLDSRIDLDQLDTLTV